MKYHSPTIEDFGKIDRQVHNITSPPNTHDDDNDLQIVTSTGGGGGSGASGLGVLGVAAGIAAVLSARNNNVEPVVGPVEEEDAPQAGKFD